MHLYLAVLAPVLCGIILAFLMVRIFTAYAPWEKLNKKKRQKQKLLKERIYEDFHVDIYNM